MCFDPFFTFFFLHGTYLMSIISSSVTRNTLSVPVSKADLILFFLGVEA